MIQVKSIGEYSESPELAVTIAYFPFDLIDVFGLMMSSHMCVSVHTYTCWLCCPVSSCPMSNLCVFCPNRISSNGAFHFRCKWIQWNSIKIRYSAETILLCFLTTCRIFLSSFGITCFFCGHKINLFHSARFLAVKFYWVRLCVLWWTVCSRFRFKSWDHFGVWWLTVCENFTNKILFITIRFK